MNQKLKIIIRKAVEKDIKHVVELSKGLCQLENYPHQKLGASEFKKFLRGNYTFMFVAEAQKKVVGYITGFRSDDYFFLPFAAVYKKYRRRGIAKLLLEKVEEMAKKEKMKYILYTAYTSNKAIEKFSKVMGYKKSRTLIQYFKIL
ncbi:MAG: GNAT family N-acetyltransferase [Candidatus Roizmanbacteria bacterium]|nr:GNAT family N-acetyltransferase [Candidatus Roizmanbacteria bacterium]